MRYYNYFLVVFIAISNCCFSVKGFSQTFESVKIISVFSGIDTNNTLFKASSPTIPSLGFIRAQRIGGPQNGIFTQQGDNIRYTSISSTSGIPGNLSRIRFTFLESDKKTPIKGHNLRFIINDIDGPNNEALATNCDGNLSFLGTANPTNLVVANLPPNIMAVGSVEEFDGPTSRLMFEFNEVSMVEFDNYANEGYLKDFDMDNDYPITTPLRVRCQTVAGSIFTQLQSDNKKEPIEFEKNDLVVIIKTNPIYFDLDKSEITEEAKVEMDKVLETMKKYPEIKLKIQSHTDSRAQSEYNLELSNQRAKSSANWLIDKGVNPLRITSEGLGETALVNKCIDGVECTEEEHQLNRRTEFVIINPEMINRKNQ